ncbi:uncharacterized protein LOC143021897 [Oratosquilla oratoria]|uniref:uncharacterized protein LOC143021897 n=1 Tax=Oratosquilla oratoria TaxID=337810 RepID=UPI003F761B29
MACTLARVAAVGACVGIWAVLMSSATLGFYSWKLYEIENQCSNDTNSTETTTEVSIDVCNFTDLQWRTYVGVGEGIVGIIAATLLIISFSETLHDGPWVWVAWCLGITGYNSYCIYDYHRVLLDGQKEFPWSTISDEDYGLFFLTAVASVGVHLLTLVILVPLAITFSVKLLKNHGFGFDLLDYDNPTYELN